MIKLIDLWNVFKSPRTMAMPWGCRISCIPLLKAKQRGKKPKTVTTDKMNIIIGDKIVQVIYSSCIVFLTWWGLWYGRI